MRNWVFVRRIKIGGEKRYRYARDFSGSEATLLKKVADMKGIGANKVK